MSIICKLVLRFSGIVIYKRDYLMKRKRMHMGLRESDSLKIPKYAFQNQLTG